MSGESVERFEDMSPDGKLLVHCQPDGDVIVAIWPSKDSRERNYISFVSAEFCMPVSGGGQSPHTLKALRALFEAMELDNKEYPQNERG